MDNFVYAWERNEMYGVPNDLISLVYDRLVCNTAVPRKPSYLSVDEEYPFEFGFTYSKVFSKWDDLNYYLTLCANNVKQIKLAQNVCKDLQLDCAINNKVVEITIPMKYCGMRIDKYLLSKKLPLELCNRLGFKQYPDNETVYIENDDEENIKLEKFSLLEK